MENFLRNLPLNHWISYGLTFLLVISLVYVVYFYFSSEGRDERGKKIFSKASLITFVVTMLLFIYLAFNLELLDYNLRASSFVVLFIQTLIAIVQALGLLSFKKFS